MMDDPAYANEILRENPEFQARMSREVARELTHADRQRTATLEEELRKTREEIAQMRQSSARYGPAPVGSVTLGARSPAGIPTPSVGRIDPPPRTVPTNHPLGDFPVDDTQTREMQQFLAQQAASKNTVDALRGEVRTQIQQGVHDMQQNLREEQRRQAVRQQRIIEQEERRTAKTRAPPPPSARMSAQRTINALSDDDDESDVESL